MEPEPIVQPESIAKRRRRSIIAGIVFFIIALVVTFLWWLSQRPAQGTVTVALTPEPGDSVDLKQRTRYEGKYLTFTYPHDFERRKEAEAVKFPLLERVYLSRGDIEGRKIALTLQDNSGNSFEEYSSFRIRRNDSSVYAEDRTERNGLDTVFFTKASSVFEVGAFFHRGNQVVAIVVSSPTTQNGLREELESLLDSFEWIGDADAVSGH